MDAMALKGTRSLGRILLRRVIDQQDVQIRVVRQDHIADVRTTNGEVGHAHRVLVSHLANSETQVIKS